MVLTGFEDSMNLSNTPESWVAASDPRVRESLAQRMENIPRTSASKTAENGGSLAVRLSKVVQLIVDNAIRINSFCCYHGFCTKLRKCT
jgi:hypothetical protein